MEVLFCFVVSGDFFFVPKEIQPIYSTQVLLQGGKKRIKETKETVTDSKSSLYLI